MTFSNPQAIAGYAENTARRVPGLHDAHRMVNILLAESTPSEGRVLIVGAGGGLELRLFAQSNSGWQFDGVDPSGEMLELARKNIGELAPRVRLHKGYVQVAPMGPFDSATCLLTLHFIAKDERYQTLREIHS